MTIAVHQPRKLTIPDFLRFYETRPDEERWQLIDGVALLMTSPFLLHQAIAAKLQELLNAGFKEGGAPFRALQRVGIERAQFPHCRPEPDICVVDREFPPDQRHVTRFHLAAEIPRHPTRIVST